MLEKDHPHSRIECRWTAEQADRGWKNGVSESNPPASSPRIVHVDEETRIVVHAQAAVLRAIEQGQRPTAAGLTETTLCAAVEIDGRRRGARDHQIEDRVVRPGLPFSDPRRGYARVHGVGEAPLPEGVPRHLPVVQARMVMPRSVSISFDCSLAEASIASALASLSKVDEIRRTVVIGARP